MHVVKRKKAAKLLISFQKLNPIQESRDNVAVDQKRISLSDLCFRQQRSVKCVKCDSSVWKICNAVICAGNVCCLFPAGV